METVSMHPYFRKNGCVALDEGMLESFIPPLAVTVISGEIASVQKQVRKENYEHVLGGLIKEYGQPTRSGSERFPVGPEGMQRSSTWEYGKTKLILVDRTADNETEGFLKLIDDTRVWGTD